MVHFKEFHCFCLSRTPVSSGSCIPTYCPGDLNDFCGSKGSNYRSGLVTDVMVYTIGKSKTVVLLEFLIWKQQKFIIINILRQIFTCSNQPFHQQWKREGKDVQELLPINPFDHQYNKPKPVKSSFFFEGNHLCFIIISFHKMCWEHTWLILFYFINLRWNYSH